jgi:putative ABC transport system ATP-binding protein
LESVTPAIVRVEGVSKTYRSGSTLVHALRGASIVVAAGEFVAVMGPSGSGKSTLLHLIAGLDVPSSGSIYVRDQCVSSMSDDDATSYRRKHVGVVYQSFNLFPDLTVEENVGVPLVLDGRPERETRERVSEMLTQLGLSDRRRHRPSEISGGEQQRAAIARALVAEPTIVLADEPTGNLDSYTGERVLADMRGVVERAGCTLVVVTHDYKAAAYADRIERLLDGAFVAGAEDE